MFLLCKDSVKLYGRQYIFCLFVSFLHGFSLIPRIFVVVNILGYFTMDKLASLWAAARKSRFFNKYLITLAGFVILVGFLDENSMVQRLQYMREERLLQSEIERYRKEYEESTARLNELAADSDAIERVAREKYLMKKPNEDIFVFEGDFEE